MSSLCGQVHDTIEALPRAARNAAVKEVLNTCFMSPYFDRALHEDVDIGDEGLYLRISRRTPSRKRRRHFLHPPHPRVRPLFPGKADQLERKLDWDARESWEGQHDYSPEGQEAAAEMEESSDTTVVDPPGAFDSIWDALRPNRKDRSNNPDYTKWPIGCTPPVDV